MIVRGPWEWRDSKPGFAWCGPVNALASLDLRTSAQLDQFGGKPLGFGLFETKDDPGSKDFTILGDSAKDTISDKNRIQLAQDLKIDGLDSTQIGDVVWEILTRRAEGGDDAVAPIMPNTHGVLELHFGSIERSQPLSIRDVEWRTVQKNFQSVYRKTLEAVNAGKAVPDADRKLLTEFMWKMKTDDHTLFIPDDLPVVTPVKPETVRTDSFFRSNSGTLGSSSEGWSWTTNVGTWDVNGNTGRNTAGAESNVRSEGALSGNDHYCQARYWTGAGTFWGLTTRVNSGNLECYIGFCNVSGGDFRLSRLSTIGARTDYSPTAGGGGLTQNDLVKVTINGSTLSMDIAGVNKLTRTATDIASNVNCGMFAYALAVVTFINWEAGDLGTPPDPSLRITVKDHPLRPRIFAPGGTKR